MGADEVGIVDIGVVEIAVRLHLGLHRLHDLAFAEELMIDFDAGDILEDLGQDFRFVFVGGNRFGKDIDFHPFERRGGFGEPLQLGALVGARRGWRAKAGIADRPCLGIVCRGQRSIDGVVGERGLPRKRDGDGEQFDSDFHLFVLLSLAGKPREKKYSTNRGRAASPFGGAAYNAAAARSPFAAAVF